MSRTHTAQSAIKDPKMMNTKQFKRETNGQMYVQNNERKNKYDR